ncbi:MAG: hypothetical protein ACOY0T_31265 [Myxococcota bacterium]
MRTCRSFWVLFLIVIGTGVLPFAGCGPSSEGRTSGKAGAGGESDAHGVFAAGSGGAAGEGGAPHESAVAGAGGTAERGSGGSAGEAGSGSEAGAGSAHTCDPETVDAPDDDFVDANCDGIDGDASRGVFVSPKGASDASGTLSSPVDTITRAIELATQKHFDVYVCNGTYRDNVVITTGVNIYGGYDCARNWLRIKDRAVVQPEQGLPLVINSVRTAMLIDRIAFRARSEKYNWKSSQAGGILNSTQVRLSHVEFVAGNGSDGQGGTPGVPALGDRPDPGSDGASSSLTTCDTNAPGGLCSWTAPGGSGRQVACEFDGTSYETMGGPGADGVNPWLAQSKPICMALVKPTETNPGGHGMYRMGGSDWSFLPSDAKEVEDGISGPGAQQGIGSLDGVLYVPSNVGGRGTSGRPGLPGAGGDGGPGHVIFGDPCSYNFAPGSGGGQGGPGGCGGQGGTGGSGGGASLALVVVNSQVVLDWPRLVTGNGGRGGKGAVGGAGQPGGAAGNAGSASHPLASGKPGAPGTAGGTGGSGGPGGGGPSIGILYVGTAPVVNNGDFSLGLPGNSGELMGGTAAAIGVTAPIYALDASK